ncbi:MAG TPA: rhomboid family intramembrane serine protease, partial [Pyrinomonadaceae bacterium]|nr:rhomboid family intramembrane serine protease [Pyrinomonadaceae bacterium]
MSLLFKRERHTGINKILSDQRTSLYSERPSVCRNCSAIVGAGETACPQCGSPLAAANAQAEAQRPVYDREAMRFARAVLTRPYNFTILFLVANLFVFMLMWGSSGFQSSALMSFPSPVLEAYGAKLNYLINAGQWWRFVTPVFIHVNLPHILVNMWSLWVVGPYVEKLYGSAKFVFFWVLTGVAGVVASYLTVRPDMHINSVGRFLFKTMDNPSAGASGALFGLVGVLFVFGIKFRHELPDGFKRAFGTGLLPMILINLFIGYLGRGFIDNAAHLGGFFSGALVALFVHYKRPGERATTAIIWHILQLAALALVAVSFLMVARNFPARIPASDEARTTSEEQGQARIAAYLKATNDGEKAFIEAFNSNETGAFDPAIKELKDAPPLDETADALRNELISLLERLHELGPKPEKATSRQIEQRKKLGTEFQVWQEKHIEWAKANREKYGLKINEGE